MLKQYHSSSTKQIVTCCLVLVVNIYIVVASETLTSITVGACSSCVGSLLGHLEPWFTYIDTYFYLSLCSLWGCFLVFLCFHTGWMRMFFIRVWYWLQSTLSSARHRLPLGLAYWVKNLGKANSLFLYLVGVDCKDISMLCFELKQCWRRGWK